MTLLLDLFISFFKIGLIGFGGGYAIITLLQNELAMRGWLSATEFADIVAVSQMTPGPLAVNAATYIGARVAGFAGAVLATFSVSLPSFILVVIVARFFVKFNNYPAVLSVMSVMRPATAGLIASAMVFFAEMSIFNAPLKTGISVNPGALVTAAVIGLSVKYLKLHPILAVALSAMLGIIIC